MKAIRNTPIALPSAAEQSTIVVFLDTKTAILDQVITRTQRQIELVREYRTRLIADVVTGKLDVRGCQVGRTFPSAPHLKDVDLLDGLDEDADLETAGEEEGIV